MSKKKSNSTLTIIVAIVVPIALFLIVSDIARDLNNNWRNGETKAMFAWLIYIGIVGVFEYFWLTRNSRNK